MASRQVARSATCSAFTSPFSTRKACGYKVVGQQREARSEVFEDFLTLLQVFVVSDQSLFAPGLQTM